MPKRKVSSAEEAAKEEPKMRLQGCVLNLLLQNYRCDDFVVNDTKLGLVQKVREHLQNLENNIEQFCCYFKELPAVELRNGKTAGRRTYHTRSQGDSSVPLPFTDDVWHCRTQHGDALVYDTTGPGVALHGCFVWLVCGVSVIWNICFSHSSGGYQQQDAHEFMRYLLDHLHLELQGGFNGVSRSAILQENSTLSASNKCCINGASTVVTAIFGGILQNEVNCLICGTESRKFDPFLVDAESSSVALLNEDVKDEKTGEAVVQASEQPVPGFTDLEELDETELYMCHKCKKKQKSTKKFWIQKLPKPENSGPESCLYDLAAVVVHHGSGVGSGHYTAYATHEGRWFHFNDSTVTPTDEETVVKAKAYILFYVERQAKAGSDKL
ncbi:Ubiquitin carboxyl-terminal hydrolase 3 [Tupaia chinensis]|uniref:ubiquitinyl hydrolase 1 n=1 Tax=Tupaia chinensis TaxID=246437 RepID=L9L9H1_TUPCH|nr:Ubiquitin carboxyl-terminal hydrolase 3 [Tupaia chinensis]